MVPKISYSSAQDGPILRSRLLARTAAGFLLLAAALLVSIKTSAADSLAEIKVALMSFTCDDNSYRSVAAGEDLVASLQAELSASTPYGWLERATLEKVEREIQLTSYGFADRSQALKAGRWAKADWGVFGRISTNSSSGRRVWLEVVSLRTAEALSDTSVMISGEASGPLRITGPDTAKLMSTLRALLEQAANAYQDGRSKPTVALLFLSKAANGSFGDLEFGLVEAFASSATNAQLPYHLLRFQRAGEAMDEAGLMLADLSDENPKALDTVAQNYVWGTYRVQPRRRLGPDGKTWRRERDVDTSIQVWDGVREPRNLEMTLTNVTSTEVAGSLLLSGLEPLVRSRPTGTGPEGVRKRISDSIVAYVAESYFWFGRAHVQRLLETACFFDPENGPARELWTRVRWGKQAGEAARNEFHFARRRSEAWGRYVDQFGFQSSAPTNRLGFWDMKSVPREYCLSAWKPFEILLQVQTEQAESGVPRDTGGPELSKWMSQFQEEFYARLLKAPSDPEVDYKMWDFVNAALTLKGDSFLIEDARQRQRILEFAWPKAVERGAKSPAGFQLSTALEPLRRHFREIGHPGGEEALLATIAPPPGIVRNTRTVKLPKISEMDFGGAGLLAVPPLTIPLPFPPAGQPKLRLAMPHGLWSLDSVIAHQGRLFLEFSTSETASAGEKPRPTEQEQKPSEITAPRLWMIDPARGTLGRITGPIATNTVKGALSLGEEVWVALAEAGTAAWNPNSGLIRRFGRAEGLGSDSCYAIAASERGVFTIGEAGELSMLSPGSARWERISLDVFKEFKLPRGGDGRKLAASGDHLLLYNQLLLLGDVRSNSWRRVDSLATDTYPLPTMDRPACMASDGHGGFYVGSGTGLHFIDAGRGAVHSQRLTKLITIQREWGGNVLTLMKTQPVPKAKLMSALTDLLAARRKFAADLANSPNARSPFEPTSRLPGWPSSIVRDGDYLWVATYPATTAAQSFLMLYHPPSRSWVGGVTLPRGELSVALSEGQLWVVNRGSGISLEVWTFNKDTFLTTPRREWLPDEVSAAQVESLRAGLTPHQQAILRLLGNDAEGAVRLLLPELDADPSSETLYLLAVAHDEIGLNRPAEMSRYAGMLAMEYPESVYTAQLSVHKQAPSGPPAGGRNPP